jgi:hypothetical protein
MINKSENFLKLSSPLWLAPPIIALFLTIFGLLQMSWPPPLPWEGKASLLRFLGFEALIFVFLIIFSRVTQKSIFVVGVVICLSLIILAGDLWSLIVALCFVFSSYLFGRSTLFFLTKTKAKLSFPETFLIGAGLYASLISVFAHFPINYPGLYSFGLLLPLLLDRKVTSEVANSFWFWLQKQKLQKISGSYLDIGLVVIASTYIVVALLPEVGYDPLVTHLFVPSQLSYFHQWGFDTSLYPFAVMPMQADWVYAINYMLGGETAARLINIGFIFILALLIRDFVVFLGGSEYFGKLAALILLTSPLAFLEGSSLHVEGIWAAFFVGGVLALFKLINSKNKINYQFIVAAFLLGFALATKAVTFLMLPAIFVLLVLNWRSAWMDRKVLRLIFFSIVVFCIFGGIPYIVSWKMTGNPVFPFFNNIFHSSFFPTEQFKDMRWQNGFRLDILYDMTFHSDRYQEARVGAPGFQWILIFLPSIFLLARAKSYKSLLLIFIGIFSIFLIFKYIGSYLRYIFPALALMIPAMVIGYQKGFLSTNRLGRFIFLTSISAVLLLNLIFLNAASWYGDFQLYPIYNKKIRDEYINNHLPVRAAVELVNRLNTTENPVAFISSPFGAGLKGDALYAAWYNSAFLDSFVKIKTDKDAIDFLLDRSVEYVILDKDWESKNYELQRTHIENVTKEIKKFGNIFVRQVNLKSSFDQELLKNERFISKENWDFSSGAIFDPSTSSVYVSESSPITQSVTVKPGREYRNIVSSRCASYPSIGRIQINWHDKKGIFIKPDIITFQCSINWTEHVMTVVAPKNANFAVVYTSGHTNQFIAYKRNSLLQ